MSSDNNEKKCQIFTSINCDGKGKSFSQQEHLSENFNGKVETTENI